MFQLAYLSLFNACQQHFVFTHKKDKTLFHVQRLLSLVAIAVACCPSGPSVLDHLSVTLFLVIVVFYAMSQSLPTNNIFGISHNIQKLLKHGFPFCWLA